MSISQIHVLLCSFSGKFSDVSTYILDPSLDALLCLHGCTPDHLVAVRIVCAVFCVRKAGKLVVLCWVPGNGNFTTPICLCGMHTDSFLGYRGLPGNQAADELPRDYMCGNLMIFYAAFLLTAVYACACMQGSKLQVVKWRSCGSPLSVPSGWKRSWLHSFARHTCMSHWTL